MLITHVSLMGMLCSKKFAQIFLGTLYRDKITMIMIFVGRDIELVEACDSRNARSHCVVGM